jgi:hypothetical protein
VCGIAGFALFTAPVTYAQTSGVKQDQVMQELLSEVHQLRVAIQQISVNAYRGQVMVERLRLQQEQVARLARELNSIRAEIGEMKAAQVNAKVRVEDGEKKLDRGEMSDSQVFELRATLADIKRREEVLSERETQLSIELGHERINLADLNKQLDSLEREMVLTNQVDQPRKKPK